ncbi:MAG: plasmid pRiA4b ORF-3 family protein [Bacteroidota bacterium]
MIFQLKVTLEGAKPPIWRRLEVEPDTLLSDLHKIIQTAMGWTNSHLHQFDVNRRLYAPPSEYDDYSDDYTGLKIHDFFLRKGDKLRYEYDFGDSWSHLILLEEVKEKEADVYYPRCTKGKRACPPEDCGGIWGYMELVEVMKKKKGARYQEMKEWLGGDLDPEAFDLEEINEGLKEDNFGVFDYGF